MKVVVMCVGLNRSLSHTYPSMHREIVRAMRRCPGVKPEFRLLLIQPSGGISNPRSGEKGAVEEVSDEVLRHFRVSYLNQGSLAAQTQELTEVLIERGDTWGDGFHSVRNATVYLRALEIAYSSVPRDADVVVCLRPDLSIEGRLHLCSRVWSVHLLRRIGVQSVIMPRWGGWKKKGGMNDRFAILTLSATEAYMTRIRLLPGVLAEGESFYTGALVRYALSGHRVRRTIRTPMLRVRLGGVREPRDAVLLERGRATKELMKQVRKMIRRIRRGRGL